MCFTNRKLVNIMELEILGHLCWRTNYEINIFLLSELTR